MRSIILLLLLFCILFSIALGRSFYSEFDIKLNEISTEYHDDGDVDPINNDLMSTAMKRKQMKNNYLMNLQHNRNEMEVYTRLNNQDMKI